LPNESFLIAVSPIQQRVSDGKAQPIAEDEATIGHAHPGVTVMRVRILVAALLAATMLSTPAFAQDADAVQEQRVVEAAPAPEAAPVQQMAPAPAPIFEAAAAPAFAPAPVADSAPVPAMMAPAMAQADDGERRGRWGREGREGGDPSAGTWRQRPSGGEPSAPPARPVFDGSGGNGGNGDGGWRGGNGRRGDSGTVSRPEPVQPPVFSAPTPRVEPDGRSSGGWGGRSGWGRGPGGDGAGREEWRGNRGGNEGTGGWRGGDGRRDGTGTTNPVRPQPPVVVAPQPQVDGDRRGAGGWSRGSGVLGTAGAGREGWRGNRDGNWRGSDGRGNDGRGQRWGDRDGRRDQGGWNRDPRRDNGNWGRSNDTWRGQDYRRDTWRGDGSRYGNNHRWDRSWRNDQRYDWQRYRTYNRDFFRQQRYYAPYGYNYGYRRFSIGLYLGSAFFGQRYWIDDPYDYRLPEVYPPYRWIRYYNDVLLVDTDSGQVVDVIYDFFW
jgi:hypothetical protein